MNERVTEEWWIDMTGESLCTQRKICPSDTLPLTNPTRTGLGLNPSLHSKRPVTNLSTITQMLWNFSMYRMRQSTVQEQESLHIFRRKHSFGIKLTVKQHYRFLA
jgi:hypothetical protein